MKLYQRVEQIYWLFMKFHTQSFVPRKGNEVLWPKCEAKGEMLQISVESSAPHNNKAEIRGRVSDSATF